MANGAPFPEKKMIQTKDISKLIKGLLTVSHHAFVKEVIIDTLD